LNACRPVFSSLTNKVISETFAYIEWEYEDAKGRVEFSAAL